MASLNPDGPSSVAVKTSSEGGTPVVSLSGELDLTNVRRVESVLEDIVTTGTGRLVVEMSGLEFMDSSGLALLASVARKVPEVELRAPSLIVRRLIELTGLAEILNVIP